jgi:hypothetical protein
MSATAPTPPADPTHDPPAGGQPDLYGPPVLVPGGPVLPTDRPLTDDEVIIPRPAAVVADVARTVEHRRTATASNLYLIIAQRLHDDPLNITRAMLQGRYRLKRRRSRFLWLDIETRQPVPELMSLRQAAEELRRLTGEDISHETLRRWWKRVWPDEDPDRLGDLDAARREAAERQSNPSVPPAVFADPGANAA